MAQWGCKEKPERLFDSLKALAEDRQKRENENHDGDGQKLISSGFLNKLVGDSGWDVKVD